VINSYTSSGDAEVAIAGARAGADVVRSMYGQWLPRIDKAAGDFATAADVAAEEVILDVIRAARPGDAVLGEEGGHQGAADAVRRWLVDPLCGTLNYAVGTMVVAVNVALRDGAAAVADPFGGEVFFTDGETAWVRHDGDDDALLTSTPASRLVDVNLDPPFPSAPGFRAVDLLAHPEFVERSGRGSCPRPWRLPGSLPASAPRTSPMAATSPGACTSPPVSPCAGLPAVLSPALTAPRSVRQAAGLWSPPTTRPTGC
jgi:myo-inositol-1(or 4)-monophosphatase